MFINFKPSFVPAQQPITVGDAIARITPEMSKWAIEEHYVLQVGKIYELNNNYVLIAWDDGIMFHSWWELTNWKRKLWRYYFKDRIVLYET